MPLSVLTGKKEIMQLAENDVFFFTTFGGEALSLSAAKATIKEIVNKHVPVYLNDTGRSLREGYNKLADELGLDFTKCVGYNFRSMVTFNHPTIDALLLKSLVQQELIRQGVLWTGFHNMCYSHSEEDITYTLKAYEQALNILKESVQKNNVAEMIKGKPIQPVFRKTDNFNTKPVTKV
jgi:glutamate-1-semialdehyde 2,1-aminomutase/spore coat polysaccharide biosynthesis protein SpsF